MNYDFKTDCDSNNNCNSNAKNSSEIDLDNLTFEFISEINDKLYEYLSNIANILFVSTITHKLVIISYRLQSYAFLLKPQNHTIFLSQ